MNTDKFKNLLLKLQQRTQTGDVTWEKTSNDQQFQTVVGGYVIRLLECNDGQSLEPDYVLRIIDHEGAVIESMSDVELQQQNPDFKAFTIMSDIFRLARRSAMGVDKALDSILEDLDNPFNF